MEAWSDANDKPVTISSRNRNYVRAKSSLNNVQFHDLRRTVETNLTKLGFTRFIADRLLNHVDGGVGGTYDRHDYLAEKTEAMNGWAGHLNNLVQQKLPI